MKVAVILDSDLIGSAALRDTLASLGYEARVMSDVGAVVDALRTSPTPMAVFFNVEAHGATLDGQDYSALIGVLLADPALTRGHIYAVISSTADDVERTLGKALDRLGALLFSKPCAADALETYLTMARGRMASWAPSEVATI